MIASLIDSAGWFCPKVWRAHCCYVVIAICGLVACAEPGLAKEAPPGAASGWAPVSVERSPLADLSPTKTGYGANRHGAKSKKARPEISPAGGQRQPVVPAEAPSEQLAAQVGQERGPEKVANTAATAVTPPPATSPPAPEPAAHATPASSNRAESPTYNSAVQKFCAGIGPAAADARIAWQRRMLGEVEKEIDERIKRLEGRIAEHREWLRKREEFAEKAAGALVQILTKMTPEIAAQQLAQMDEQTAAALILKLDPKVAAPMLDEVPAAKAARLSAIIVAATGKFQEKRAKDGGDASASSAPAPAGNNAASAPPPGEANAAKEGGK